LEIALTAYQHFRSTTDDLDKVKNIGRRVLDKNKDIFVFE
jgi:DNA uptake protein ComE-like DNA-binding protein